MKNNEIKNNLKEFLQIKNSTETTADLYFYGDIVSDGWSAWEEEDQYPLAIKDFLANEEGKNLNIYINSGGGSVFAGMAIYNMLKRHKGYKTVYVDGLAASIASIIALAGDKIIIPDSAFFMIHKPWMGLWGCYNSDDFIKMANDLDRIEEGILNIYKNNIKAEVDFETIKEMVKAETWLTGNEAAQYFNIEATETVQAVACSSNYFNKYSKVPANFKRKENNQSNNNNEKNKILLKLKILSLAGKVI